MLVTASWGGADVAVEVDAECRSVAALKRCLQEALPEVDVEAVRLEVCGRPVDDEGVLGLVDGSVIDVSATQAALAAATLREEGCPVDFSGFSRKSTGKRAEVQAVPRGWYDFPPGVRGPLLRHDYRVILASSQVGLWYGPEGQQRLHASAHCYLQGQHAGRWPNFFSSRAVRRM